MRAVFQVTYLGHATVLLQMGETQLITDPNFNHRAGISRRRRGPGISFQELPTIDLILISHAHLDHLDAFTLKKFPKETRVVAPSGVGGLINALGFKDVTQLGKWQSVTFQELKVTAIPAKHWGSRYVIDFWRGYSGYIVEGHGKTVYFAGDTDYFATFKDIGQKFQVDLALLPIGSIRPSFVMGRYHLTPSEAIQAFRDLSARHMVPIHWGTFRLSLEPLGEPLARLKALLKDDDLAEKVWVLHPGQSRDF